MAKKNFLVDIDLNNNQLLNVTLQNLATAPSVVGKIAGFPYWNTTDKTCYVYTGQASPDEWLNLGQIYSHYSGAALSPTLTGAQVLASLAVNTEGHVTAATTRTLTLADLGYTGDNNANYYAHPTFTGNTLTGSPLTGSLVISNVVVNSNGHVTSFSTRSLTPADIGAATTAHSHVLSSGATDVTASAAEVNLLHLAGMTAGWVLRATGAATAAWGQLLGSQISNDLSWVSIADTLTNLTQTWSSSKIQAMLDSINSTISGALINKGGYNAATNVPNLDVAPSASIKNGWTYTITAAGAFFTENMQIGDMIISNQDAPITLAHWTVVNKNIPDIVQGTTSTQGILQLATDTETQTGTDTEKAITSANLTSRTSTETRTGIAALATQTEVNTGTNDTKIITPLKLKTFYDATVGGYSANFGNGALTAFNFTHTLNTLDVTIAIVEVATGETVEMQVRRTSTTVINVQCNVAPTTNQYRVVIKK